MAVYTPFTLEELRPICQSFGLSGLREAVGIPQGSINTNYRLEVDQGRFFFRHTTARSKDDLLFEASLVEFLAESQFPSPRLVRAKGAPFLETKGGLASIFHFLPGEEMSRDRVTPEHCEQVGRELGKMHRLGLSFGGERKNPYSRATVRAWLGELKVDPDPELSKIGFHFLRFLDPEPRAELLPRGVIHADLFLDNVKWVGDRISAFFDFEMACRDVLVLDLAITLNAWCFNERYDGGLCRAIVRGYQQERALTEPERPGLYHQAVFGAVRYTASRIRDFHLSKLPPDRLFRKDFRTYLARANELTRMGEREFSRLVGLDA